MQDKLNAYNASKKSGAECTTVAHESIKNIKSLVNGLKYSKIAHVDLFRNDAMHLYA